MHVEARIAVHTGVFQQRAAECLDTRTLDHLCSYLDCQPGDLLEYVPDEAQEGNVPNETE